MTAESVALIPQCAECEAEWLPTDHERWRASSAATSSTSRPSSSSTARDAPSASSGTTEGGGQP